MNSTEYWIVNGKVDLDPYADPANSSAEKLMQHSGGVHVSAGQEGTVVRWAMFASNWASLYYVAETLLSMPGPYTFEFFLSGWFTQTVNDPSEAYLRLNDLIVKSDIHLREKTFVKSMDADNLSSVSNLIGETLVGGQADLKTVWIVLMIRQQAGLSLSGSVLIPALRNSMAWRRIHFRA
mgnify:CR=1 FL=1